MSQTVKRRKNIIAYDDLFYCYFTSIDACTSTISAAIVHPNSSCVLQVNACREKCVQGTSYHHHISNWSKIGPQQVLMGSTEYIRIQQIRFLNQTTILFYLSDFRLW